MPEEVSSVISLHPAQWRAFNTKSRYTAVICGVQSGKTFLGAVWAQKKIDEKPKGTGLIAAPTYKILQQSTLRKFFEIFPEWQRYYRQQQGDILFPSGGRIFIRSADDPYGLEGMTLDWAWLDEAGQMSRMVWTVIRARVGTTGGKVMMTTTPYSLNWLHSEVFLPWREGRDSDIGVFTWRSVDNPYFPPEEVEKERIRLSPEEFARRYEGEFTRLEGLIWDLPASSILDMSPAIEKTIEFAESVVAGLDWGFSEDHPAASLLLVGKDGVWYVIDEWKESGKTTSEILVLQKEWKAKRRVSIVYPDPARPDAIEELKRGGIGIGATPRDVALGLGLVAGLIREKRLFVLRSCEKLLKEMESYSWARGVDGQPVKEAPIKENDHLCDALRYAVAGHRIATPRPKNLRNVPSGIEVMLGNRVISEMPTEKTFV